MSEYQPLCTMDDLQALDEDECLAGYMAGLDNDPEPGSDKNKSFWHGWRNGMIDKGRLPFDAASTKFASVHVTLSELIRKKRHG